jgi:esterase FrsA
MANTRAYLRILWGSAFLLVSAIPLPLEAFAEEKTERTIEEIKVEAIKRAQTGMYPMIGLNPVDVEEAFTSIKTRDKNEWATAFIHVADRYMAEGQALETTDPEKANADFIRAWRVYSFGRWPIPSSPKKKEAYAKAIEAFLAHARFWDPALEVVRIPFEGSEIIGYVRLPKNAKGPVPMVIAVNGLDSRKEDLTESFGAILP